MLLPGLKNYHQFYTTKHLLIFNFMYNKAKRKKIMEYKKLAQDILLLNESKNEFKAPFITNYDAIKKSNDFYHFIFNGALKNIDNKISYVYDPKLVEYEGFCKPTEFSSNGVDKVTIILPEVKSIKKVITITHEKAHAYHMLSKVKTSELVPSFLDILNAIVLDSDYPGIKVNNLDYKIKEAKKVATTYLNRYSKYSKKVQENYMNDFLGAIYLVNKYLLQDENITEETLKNLINKGNNLTYEDDFDISKAIEFIKKR